MKLDISLAFFVALVRLSRSMTLRMLFIFIFCSVCAALTYMCAMRQTTLLLWGILSLSVYRLLLLLCISLSIVDDDEV